MVAGLECVITVSSSFQKEVDQLKRSMQINGMLCFKLILHLMYFACSIFIFLYIISYNFTLKCIDALKKDDWSALQVKITRLQAQGKVIFYHPCAVKDKHSRKQLFVVVLQDKWMRDVAKKFSHGNSWALDSTFKTNQYALPLYNAVVPNQDKKGMPTFYMLRNKDKKQGHEGITFELALIPVFASIGK